MSPTRQKYRGRALKYGARGVEAAQIDMDEDRQYWQRARAADEKFQAALERSGRRKTGPNTASSAERPKQIPRRIEPTPTRGSVWDSMGWKW